MKKTYVTIIGVLFSFMGFSQSCLPDGITFTTQAQINSFQVNYPNCTQIEGDVTISGDDIYTLAGLNFLTSIDGNVAIYSNPLLTNLNGLNGLNTIGGNLSIGIYESGFNLGNPALLNLSGLDNLAFIGGGLTIKGNSSLTSFEELGSLISIGDLIEISSNPVLVSLTGLNNIDTVFGVVIISGNDFLTDLDGLNGLISVGQLDITGNSSLISLAGLNNLTLIDWNLFIEFTEALIDLDDLENLQSIGHNIYIDGNQSLTSLSGLDNVEATSPDYILIIYNSSLYTCNLPFICDNLANPVGTIEIHDNATGCNSQEEVEAACLNNCLPDGITFNTQAQIDSFQVNYPTCSEIQGGVTIWGDDIGNLDGLSNITKIGGFLEIRDNPVLTNLTGLLNVTQIGGTLYIGNCYVLTSIDGIKNIDASSIILLHIIGNISLSDCAVQSVCDYLASPNGFFEIYGNGSGCGSEGEVFYQCVQEVKESEQIDNFTISPNPATTAITISLPTTTPVDNTTLSIYNVSAQQVILRCITEPITVLDIGALTQGVYFARVTADKTVMVNKFIKR
jgi:hypothetical protein